MKVWMCGWWVLFILLFCQSIFAQIPVTIDTHLASPGDTICVPISVGSVTGENIESFQFDLVFDSSVLFPIEVSFEGTIAEDWGDPFINAQIPGHLKIGSFSLHPIMGEGILTKVKFRVVGQIGDTSRIELKDLIFNDGDPTPLVQNGLVIVEKRVLLVIYSNRNNIRVRVDGNEYCSPVSIPMFSKTTHIVSVDSIQNTKGARYIFHHWSDGGSAAHNVTLGMTGDTLFAVFMKQFYLTVRSNDDTLSGSGWYNENDIAHFSAKRCISVSDSVRFRFLCWSGDVNSVNPTDSTVMDTSKVVVANYAQENFVFIRCNPDRYGKTVPPPPGLWVEKGSTIELMAYPQKNYCFWNWSGDIASTSNPISVSVYAPLHITANFGDMFPVKLILWQVKEQSGNSVTFHWKTESEIKNYGFYVQRKGKSSKFQNIAFIKGKGTTNAEHNYFYTDENLPPGVYDYRLRQVDLSGAEYFSPAINVKIPATYSLHTLDNYPNPFQEETTLSIHLKNDEWVKLSIFNLLGQEIYHFQTKRLRRGTHNFSWFGQNDFGERVSNGVYIVKLQTAKFSVFRKLIFIDYKK